MSQYQGKTIKNKAKIRLQTKNLEDLKLLKEIEQQEGNPIQDLFPTLESKQIIHDNLNKLLNN